MEMTVYEIVATIIAALALIQPWLIAAYKKFCKKIKVVFRPSSTIKLFYNQSGSYVSLGGVIESKNKSCVVNNISVKVVRDSDKAELNADWSIFSSPIFQLVAGNAVTSSETARPFKIESNNLYPVFVEFVNKNSNENDKIKEIIDDVKNKTHELIKNPVDFSTNLKSLKQYKKYKEYEKELLENYYWKEGKYSLYLNITYNEKEVLQNKYDFNITKDDVKKFKDNITKSLDCEMYNCYRQTLSFFSAQKEFKNN